MNLKRLGVLTLPTWLRGRLTTALMYAGIKPLSVLLQELRRLRAETARELGRNGQVCRLRGALNDELDPTERRIRIIDGGITVSGATSRVWMRETGLFVIAPMRRGGTWKKILRRGVGEDGFDFLVVAPLALRNKEIQLRGVADTYKLAGKRYAISYT